MRLIVELVIGYALYRYGRLVESYRLRAEFDSARALRLAAEELSREAIALASEVRSAPRLLKLAKTLNKRLKRSRRT